MELKDCSMVQLLVVSKESVEKGAEPVFPIAEVIAIAPSKSEAEKYAKNELEPHLGDKANCLFRIKDLGPILFPPYKTTIFLYTQAAGRIG